MIRASLLAAVLLAAVSPAAVAGTFTVTVAVVNDTGQPVPKADVGLFWQVKDGVMATFPDLSAITDAAGKAVLRVEDRGEKRPVLVLSADRKRGAWAGVSQADADKTVTVALGPTVRMTGEIACKELNTKPEWANTYVTPGGFKARAVQHSTKEARYDFILPAGKYQLWSYGTDVEDDKRTVELTADRPEHDLGVIDLKASPVAKLKGKVPPAWTIADARGVKKEVKLSDYKGKWVYLEFWGHW